MKAAAEAEKQQAKEIPTQGIQISQITGPTRDILVSALSPLKQLDTTFPAMLDELKLIRGILSGKPIIPAAAPALNVPVIQLPEGVKPAFDMPNMQPAVNIPQQPFVNPMLNFGANGFNPAAMLNQNPLVQIPRFAMQPEVNMPDFARFHGGGEPLGRPDVGFVSANGDSISIQGGITIQVQQVTDISIDEIDRQLQRELISHRRAVGNRGRVARIT